MTCQLERVSTHWYGNSLALLCVIMLTTACATTYYQPYIGAAPGYSEASISKDTYRVEFRGDSSLLSNDLNRYLFYRCAELALSLGAKSFGVVYGYNDYATAVAIIRIGFPEVAPSLGWYDAASLLKELGSELQIPPHQVTASPKLGFDLGTATGVMNYPFTAKTVDSQTYHLRLKAEIMPAHVKLIDHTLFYRAAKFAEDRGADYFVILSGRAEEGTREAGGSLIYPARPPDHFPWYARSIVIRLFSGKRPEALISAFGTQEILDRARQELPFGRQNHQSQAASDQLTTLVPSTVTSAVPNGPIKLVQYREGGILTYLNSAEELVERLMVRCAQATLDDGYDYFSIVRGGPVGLPWRYNTLSSFHGYGYASGTPVVYGDYPELYNHVETRIRLFRKNDLTPREFAYDARDVLKNIGQRVE